MKLLSILAAGLLSAAPAFAGVPSTLTEGMSGTNPQADAKILCNNYYYVNWVGALENPHRRPLGETLDMAWQATELQHTGHPSELTEGRSYYRQLKGWAMRYCSHYF